MPCAVSGIHLAVTTSQIHVSYSDKLAFAHRQVCFVTGQTTQRDPAIHFGAYFKLFKCPLQFSLHSKSKPLKLVNI